VHRDLKPENIIFVSDSNDANLKVIDFGTSRKFTSNKQMTKKLGTVHLTTLIKALLYSPRGTEPTLQREVRCVVVWGDPLHPSVWLPTLHGQERA
jgi:serine/threonine protein kinase